MTPQQKRNFLIVIALAVVFFILFIWPNAVGSKNLAMLNVFEPDEAAPLPSVFKMISPPVDSLRQTLKSFIFYDYYYYGFPYFAASSLLILPLKWLDSLNDMPLVMLILRQLVSVLPMLIALILLCYIQDRFRTYRSIVLFVFLFSVPAVFQNNFWWHPDSLAMLFSVFTIFFLVRDNLNFGKNFLFAAAACGLAAATKIIGVYFFLAVGLTLLAGVIQRKATFKKLVGMSLAFIGVMAAAYFIGSPFLVSGWARTSYYDTMVKQSFMLSNGYGVVYEKGLLAAWPLVHQYYGEVIFLLIIVAVSVWGAVRSSQRLVFGLILAWLVPISFTVFVLTHFKYQYFLPAAIPLFSSVALLLPESWPKFLKNLKNHWLQAAALLVVVIQFVIFAGDGVKNYFDHLYREQTEPSIAFADQIVETLKPLDGQKLNIYNDYRVYLPPKTGWIPLTSYDLLEYNFIQQNQFDVLLLQEQRIRDYLNPNVTGIDPELFARNQQFYRDANNETIAGYHIVLRNDFGLIYVKDDLYNQYFANK